jgi:hypothetical protein
MKIVLNAPTISITTGTSTSLTVSITSTNTLSGVVYDVYYGAGLFITTATTTATITGLAYGSTYNIYAYARYNTILSPQSNILSNQKTYVYATPIQLNDTTYQTNSSTTTDTFTVSGAAFTHANGTYVFSGSSADSTTHRAHRAFNNSLSETHVWVCSGSGGTNVYGSTYTQAAYGTSGYVGGGTGRYWTTTVSGISYAGEWLQVKLPYSFILKSYEIYNRATYSARIMKTGTIAGSNDGTNWFLLDLPTFPDNATYNKTFPIATNTTAYTYYRLIVTSNFGGTFINFFSIRLLGVVA